MFSVKKYGKSYYKSFSGKRKKLKQYKCFLYKEHYSSVVFQFKIAKKYVCGCSKCINKLIYSLAKEGLIIE